MGILTFVLLFGCTSNAFSLTFSRLLRITTEVYEDARLERYTGVLSNANCAKRCRGHCLAYYYSPATELCQTFKREFCQDLKAPTANSSVLYFSSNKYQSCGDVNASCPSGWYAITTTPGQTLKVFCEMQSPQGPWIVIHNRQNVKVNFYRGWEDYKKGFGDLDGNFWLGNEIIHQLTGMGYTVLRVELEAWDGSTWYIEYDTFSLASEADKYRLQATGSSGNVYDALSYHNGYQFTTFDADNDACSYCNCAEGHHGAWWYRACVDSSLNGLYQEDKGTDILNSMLWYKVFAGRFHVPMKKARMMIRKP